MEFRKNNYSNRILIINDGKLGDTIASSIIIENGDLFNNMHEVYYLCNTAYKEFFKEYKGSIKILFFNRYLFKYFLPYKFYVLFIINNYTFSKVINISPARGFINEELSLLSGGKEIIAINDDLKYLGRFGKQYSNNLYTKLLFVDKNEYFKYFNILETYFGLSEYKINRCQILKKNYKKKFQYVLISPFTSEDFKNWGVQSFIKLIDYLSRDYKIIVTGKRKETNKVFKQFYFTNNDNVAIDNSPLSELGDIIQDSSFCIGNDSAIIHLALKLDKQFLAILYADFIGKYFPFFINKNQHYIYCDIKCNNRAIYCNYKNSIQLDDISAETVYKLLREEIKIEC